MRELGLLEDLRLCGTQMGKGMSIRDRTPRARRRRPGRHSTHHRTRLCHLRAPGSRHPGMDLLDNASAGMGGIWMLSVGHRMTRRQPRMLWDALMGRKWLRHHHR